MMKTRSSRSISSTMACRMASRTLISGIRLPQLSNRVGVDVAVERLGLGPGALVGEAHRLVDGRIDLALDLVQFLALDGPFRQQVLGVGAQRVILAPGLDLFLRAVELGVGGRVAAEAVAHGLDEERSPA